MKQVSIGVIGCGVIGNAHMSAANESEFANLAAIADVVEDRVSECAEKYGISKKYSNGEDLLSDPEIDGVVLAMPTGVRGELALKAFAAGKHVLLEKPAAMSVEELKQFIDARGDLIGGCCSCRYRFLESSKFVTDFLAQGKLGKLRLIRSRNTYPVGPRPDKKPPAWRMIKKLNGGGILVNWGVYDLDYLLGINGWKLKPKTVTAQTWPMGPRFASRLPEGSDGDAHAAAFIRCENGTVIMFERAEAVAGQPEQAWQIVGDNGTLQLTMVIGDDKKIVFDDATDEKGVTSETVWEGEEDGGRCHRGPVDDFAQAILENRQPETSLEQAMFVQQITDAIYESSETGKTVNVKE